MKVRGGGRGRQWWLVIATLAALCVLAAVTTGWASRGTAVAAVIVPQTASLSHGTHAATTDVTHLRLGDHSRTVVRGFSTDPAPTHQPNNAWMTRDRPPTGSRFAPQSVRSPLPASFAAAEARPGDTDARAPAAALIDDDILTQLCVARC